MEATDGENKKMSGSQTMRRRKPKRREGDGKKEIMRVKTRQGKERRKYDDNYLGLGFTRIGDEDCPKPQCVVCSEVLANSCLKPSSLRRHLRTKHGNLKAPYIF